MKDELSCQDLEIFCIRLQDYANKLALHYCLDRDNRKQFKQFSDDILMLKMNLSNYIFWHKVNERKLQMENEGKKNES